jgi:hypothetical protein
LGTSREEHKIVFGIFRPFDFASACWDKQNKYFTESQKKFSLQKGVKKSAKQNENMLLL